MEYSHDERQDFLQASKNSENLSLGQGLSVKFIPLHPQSMYVLFICFKNDCSRSLLVPKDRSKYADKSPNLLLVHVTAPRANQFWSVYKLKLKFCKFSIQQITLICVEF